MADRALIQRNGRSVALGGGTVGQVLKVVSTDTLGFGEGGGGVAPEVSQILPFYIRGGPIQAGDKVSIHFPNGSRIDGVTLLTDQLASIKVDIWKKAMVGLPSSISDSICDLNLPEILSGYGYTDELLIGWDRTIAAGDVVTVVVQSASGVNSATLQFTVGVAPDGYPMLYFMGDPDSEPGGSLTAHWAVVVFSADDIEEYPLYTHATWNTIIAQVPSASPSTEEEEYPAYTQNTVEPLSVQNVTWAVAVVEEYPTYTHVPGVSGIVPVLFWTAPTEPEFPEYVPASTPAPDIDTITFPGANEYEFYTYTITAAGGLPFVWVITGLPTGLTATDMENGSVVVSGYPTADGSFTNIDVSCTDRMSQESTSNDNSLTVTAGTQDPIITSMYHFEGRPGETVTLKGIYFGATQGSSVLSFDGSSVTPASWADGTITFVVPSGTVGAKDVKVTVSVDSNIKSFYIVEA